MKTSELVWTFALSLLGVLAFNMLLRVVVHGFDALVAFSWLGVGIAVGVAAFVTFGTADRGTKRADSQS